jgi:hypothetical protein
LVDLLKAGKILLELGAIAERLHEIVMREAPEFEPAWREIALDAYRLAAGSVVANRDCEALSDRVETALGIGLGSLTELVLEREAPDEMERVNDALDELRCRAGFAAIRLRNLGLETAVDLDQLRAMITAIASTLIEEGQPGWAQRCRGLLERDEIDSFGACALAPELARQPWAPSLALRLGRELPALAMVLKPYITSYRRGAA